jgi:hypothetical protein
LFCSVFVIAFLGVSQQATRGFKSAIKKIAGVHPSHLSILTCVTFFLFLRPLVPEGTCSCLHAAL